MALQPLMLSLMLLQQATAFTDVSVVDPGTAALHGQTVLVRNGMITKVGPTADVAIPVGTNVVNGRGRYLTPGLIDLHTHVHRPEDLGLLLAYGVTTIRILDGERSDLRLRDAVASGKVLGPRVHVCKQVNEVGSERDAGKTVDNALKDGYDCLKLYSPPPWEPHRYAALVQAAAERGVHLGGHLPRNLPFMSLPSPTQASVAHLEEFLYTHFFLAENRPDRGLDSMQVAPLVAEIAARGTAVITSLNLYRMIGLNSTAGFDSLRVLPELRYMPRRSRNEWLDDDNRMRKRITRDQGERLLAAAYPILVKLGRDLMRAGVPVLLGTDASWNLPFSIPGPTVHWELHALVEGGWTPAEVLWAATAGPAEFLGLGAELGHVREGARADLLLLSSDPTSDVGALSAIDGVMTGGRWTRSGRSRRHPRGDRARATLNPVVASSGVRAPRKPHPLCGC